MDHTYRHIENSGVQLWWGSSPTTKGWGIVNTDSSGAIGFRNSRPWISSDTFGPLDCRRLTAGHVCLTSAWVCPPCKFHLPIWGHCICAHVKSHWCELTYALPLILLHRKGAVGRSPILADMSAQSKRLWQERQTNKIMRLARRSPPGSLCPSMCDILVDSTSADGRCFGPRVTVKDLQGGRPYQNRSYW